MPQFVRQIIIYFLSFLIALHHTGSHDELIKDPDGAYSQLIRLQEVHQAKDHQHLVNKLEGSRMSISHSLSHGSSRGSSKYHSFTLSITPPEFTQDGSANDQNNGEKGLPNKAPVGQLIKLNKPEFPILIVGSVAAAVHGIVFPMFGLIIANAIKAFYEPPHMLRKDTRFCALMYVVLGVASLVSTPVQYFLFGLAGGKLVERIQSLSFRSVLRQEVGWFDDAANSRFVNLKIH
jgi:ATP-binding cassette, subfamily B (MDR/TAP), member 1